MNIQILLASYNGEKYIGDQIKSILDQSHDNFELIIRDDASSDDTINIINSFAAYDKRISLLKDNLGNLGYVKNFEHLLLKSNADILFFSDQDDIWLENKIKDTLKIFYDNYYPGLKLLVHCDSYVCDANLNIIDIHIGKAGFNNGLKYLFFKPIVQGSCMVISKELKYSLLPFPQNIHAHDYYISLVNEGIGRRVYIEKPLMLYRQHDSNITGAKKNKQKKKNDNTKYFSLRRNVIPKNRLRTIKEYLNTHTDLPSIRKKDLEDIIIFSESKNIIKRFRKLHIFKYWVKFNIFHFIKESLTPNV